MSKHILTEKLPKVKPKKGSPMSLLVENAKSSSDLPPSTRENTENVSEKNASKFTITDAENLEFSYRVQRYYAQHLAQALLYGYAKSVVGDNEELRRKFHRTITCLRSRIGGIVKVHRSIKYGKAFYSGLCTCGGVWSCPVCAAKIQARRTLEVQDFFQWTYRKQNKQIAMITLTYPHELSDKLAESMEKHAEALKVFRAYNGSKFMKFKEEEGLAGLVRSLELTYGRNGWHPHTHELWAIDHFEKDEKHEEAIHEYILKRWKHACKKAGLLAEDDDEESFEKHSVHIVFRANDSDYIAKQNSDNDKAWGADKEVACASSKIGKSHGKTPFQILLETEESTKSRSLFIEYVLAMKGKAQLFWTPGLKSQVGVEEKTDEEIVAEQEDRADLLALLEKNHWDCVVKNKQRAQILDVAEKDGIEGLIAWFADYGLVLQPPTEEDLAVEEKLAERRGAEKAKKLEKRAKRKK